MDAADVHLERALNEYNDKVNALESKGPSVELVEAYVNRGTILYMMEYLTSAMEDLDAATEMIESLESEDISIDDGTYVKAHVMVGAILFDQDFDPIEAYSNAITRLGKVNASSRHFDRKSMVRLCIASAENLLDAEYGEEASAFIEKGLSITENNDIWLSNRRIDLLNLKGELLEVGEDYSGAIESYSEAVEIGCMLLDNGKLEDAEVLVVSLVSRAESESAIGLDDQYLSDTNIAIEILEEMLSINKIRDADLIVKLHQDMAHALIEKGKMEEAEKHLMKAMSIGVNGAKEYIRDQTNNPLV